MLSHEEGAYITHTLDAITVSKGTMVHTIEERLYLNTITDLRKFQKRKPFESSWMFRHFTQRGALLMTLFTVTLLLLPPLLPPLPPPSPLLLAVPVAIMAMLVFLAFTPSKLPNVAAINSV